MERRDSAVSNNQGASAKKGVNSKRIVFDQYDASYELIGLVGEGGQGKVCKTNHPNTLVKIFTQKEKLKGERWFNHVQWILRQDLEGLSIASPKALVVSPKPGYVMELMDGLHPLLKEMEQSFTSLIEGKGLLGFLETGGLRRRLNLLREIARTLSRLHARGLAYGDLSPSNIFVSMDVSHEKVWLIDCDNICTNERAGFDHLYTPGYGAPEIVRGESGVNSLTDAWSFAVIAFQLLTHLHPLIGELVEDAGPEAEEKAYSGELPWVDDSHDDSNASNSGIPMDLVMSRRINELFHRCFEKGKNCAWERPTLSEWGEALDEAVSMVQQCHAEDCNSTFLRAETCPFCQTPADSSQALLVTALVYSNDENLERNLLSTGKGQLLNIGETIGLKRAPAGTSLYSESDEICLIRFDEDGVAIKVSPGERIVLKSGDQQHEVTRGFRLEHEKRQGKAYYLHLIPEQQDETHLVHPVWAFRW